MKWSIYVLSGCWIALSWNNSVTAFAPLHNTKAPLQYKANNECRSRLPKPLTISFANSESDEEPGTTESEAGISTQQSSQLPSDQDKSTLQRFLSPKIDDPGLPLTDVLLAQIVAPSLQTFWISAVHAPSPSWLRPLGSYFGEAPELAPRGSLLAPVLIHGAGLAVCWLAGALAAKSYEEESFTLKEVRPGAGIWDRVRSYDTVVSRLIQAGAFATGILIVSTQLDLLLEFKRYVQYGESEETDLRILVATVELINDVVFEALVLGSWRVIHAGFMSNTGNRSKRW
ncbi:hypothetical protein ACHAWO_012372 [Cyclotella atomus]|uniref:Uncharacterized protein n=1 Tax=Cyclotella atomus TaxID=382360 RepID=A0ABD3NVG6_9STRA